MRCPHCGARLARDWSYCPYCGAKIEREDGFAGIINRMLNDVISLFSGKESKNKFTIRIKTGEEMQKARQMKMPKELVEPHSEVRRSGPDLEVIVDLEGVKSLNNVLVNVMAESLEIRAVAGKKGYFKLINIPPHYKLVSKSLNKGVLSLKLRGF